MNNLSDSVAKKIKTMHQQRRMFCIHSDQLWVKGPGSQESHTEWFISEQWMSEEGDFIEKHVRGYVNSAGDIYFYQGLDFSTNNEVEKNFFKFLNQLIKQLDIPVTAKVYGGLKVSDPGEAWPPIKEFGTVEELQNEHA